MTETGARDSAGAAAIEAEGLAKRFGEVQAVSEMTFTVARGEFFGLLGPNGAGKTTTINLLTGLARPDAGRVVVGGVDCTRDSKAAQHLIGVVPDESNLYPELTGHANLCFCGALYGLGRREREARSRELLERCGLADAADRKFGGYSRGMKRKLTIAAGVIHKPPVLFLDEPTTGIDVESARRIREMIAELHADGTTVLLTTHYIEEAERLCRRIAFVVGGRVVRVDSTERLMAPVQGKHAMVVEVAGDAEPARALLADSNPSMAFDLETPNALRVESSEPIPVGRLVRALDEAGVRVLEARKLRLSLEEVFVRVTGIEAQAMRREREGKGKPQ